MARVLMGDKTYNLRAGPGWVVEFKAGQDYPEVKREWADEIVAKGFGKELTLRSRPATRKAPKRK
jgi:hypothetical protein